MNAYEKPMLTLLGKIGDRARVAAVATADGWKLSIDSIVTADGLRYNARLISPEDDCLYALVLWPSVEATKESVAGFLRRVGHGPAATALWASLEAELKQ